MTKFLNNTKYLFFFLLVLFLFPACNSKSLEGNWVVQALVIDGVEQELCESNINFSYENGSIVAKGTAGINLYDVFVYVDGKMMMTYGLSNTGFMGSDAQMRYEELFFEAFVNCDSYKIKGSDLYIYNSSKNMELRLKR